MFRQIQLFPAVLLALLSASFGAAPSSEAAKPLPAPTSDGNLDTQAAPPLRLVFPQIGNGGGLQTTLVFHNTAANFDESGTGRSQPVSVRIELHRVSGAPLELSLSGLGTGSTFDLELSRGEALSTETSGLGDIQVGYALVFAPPGVDGTAIFSFAPTPGGSNLFEAGVPATNSRRSFSLYVDSRGNRETGVALVNPRPVNGETTAHATLRLYSTNFQLLAERTFDLDPGFHISVFVDEVFAEAAGMEGSLTVSSDIPIAAVTLRENVVPNQFPFSLTAFPVIPERADDPEMSRDPAQRVFYIPQVGDGRDGDIVFQTTLILLNTGPDANAHVEFFDSEGAPLALSLGALGTNSVFDIPLSRGASFSAQTTGVSILAAGYARVTTANRVGGTAVFTRSTPEGVVLYEAGVAAATPLTAFTLVADGLGFRDTGVALANPSSRGATLGVRLYNRHFQTLAATFLSLPPGHHRALFLSQVFPDQMAALDSGLGSVTVESFGTESGIPAPLAALTLRQSDRPGIDFPDEIPTLTTFPVIVGRADGPSNTDLSIKTTGPATPPLGGAPFTYSLSVSNRGPDIARGVLVIDTLPPGVQFVSASGDQWTCQNVLVTVACVRAQLGVEAASDILINVFAPAQPQVLVDIGDVTSDTPDPNPENNSSSNATNIVSP